MSIKDDFPNYAAYLASLSPPAATRQWYGSPYTGHEGSPFGPPETDPLVVAGSRRKPHRGSFGAAITSAYHLATTPNRWQETTDRTYAAMHPALRFAHGMLLNWAGGRLFYKGMGLSPGQAMGYGFGVAAADYLYDGELGLIGQVGLTVGLAGAADFAIEKIRQGDLGSFLSDPAGYLEREVRSAYPGIDTGLRFYGGRFSGIGGAQAYWHSVYEQGQNALMGLLETWRF